MRTRRWILFRAELQIWRILDYVPDITDNPKAVEVIAELIDKMPDIEVRGSLEKCQVAFLAAEIDQLFMTLTLTSIGIRWKTGKHR